MNRHRRKMQRLYRRFNRSRMMTRFLLMIIILLLVYIMTEGRVFFWFLPLILFLPFGGSLRRRDDTGEDPIEKSDEDDVHYV